MALENDVDRYTRVKSLVPPTVNVRLLSLGDFDGLDLEGEFDIVIIDGAMDRYQSALKSIGHVRSGGAVIFDDSDGFWEPELRRFPIIDLFHAEGWSRVDFHGFSAESIQRHCTSIFWKRDCLLFQDCSRRRQLYAR